MPSAGVYPSTTGRSNDTEETQSFIPNCPSPTPLTLNDCHSSSSTCNIGPVQHSESPTASLVSQSQDPHTSNATFWLPPALPRRVLVSQTPPQYRYSGSRRVCFSLDGIPGIPVAPPDRDIFSCLDNSDSLVLWELVETRIHLNIYWPDYHHIGGYLCIKVRTPKLNNAQASESRSPITLSAFAHTAHSRVEEMLKKLEKTISKGSGEWKLSQDQWIPEFEVQSSV
ncbi:hypothetical protein C8Q75DRAFT_807921 [Abortiporus biennis]|nr:hypothetical protein C8Q75DRAFT_807921 [Abortiporus biennis]